MLEKQKKSDTDIKDRVSLMPGRFSGNPPLGEAKVLLTNHSEYDSRKIPSRPISGTEWYSRCLLFSKF